MKCFVWPLNTKFTSESGFPGLCFASGFDGLGCGPLGNIGMNGFAPEFLSQSLPVRLFSSSVRLFSCFGFCVMQNFRFLFPTFLFESLFFIDFACLICLWVSPSWLHASFRI